MARLKKASWLLTISMRLPGIIIVGIISVSLFSCKTEEIILHGDIRGFVTDTANSQALQGVVVKLNPLNDTTSTGSDGKYLFKSLTPANYKLEFSKLTYATDTKSATVTSASSTEINFALEKIPVIHISRAVLDFGPDLTSSSFAISKTGLGKLAYTITPSKDWITVNPISGDVDNEADSITVTINRSWFNSKYC